MDCTHIDCGHVKNIALLTAFPQLTVSLLKSTVLRGAIRSGAADETSATWKAWLLASEKAVAYQRHRLGHPAANLGVALAPPPGLFDLANRFARETSTTDIAESSPSSVGDDVRGTNPTGERSPKTSLRGDKENWHLVGLLVRALGQGVAKAFKLVGVPAVLTLICLVLIAAQQRAIGKLAGQIEELAAVVSELRSERLDRHAV